MEPPYTRYSITFSPLSVMTLDVIFACKFFLDVILAVIIYSAWRESALRAPNFDMNFTYMRSILPDSAWM